MVICVSHTSFWELFLICVGVAPRGLFFRCAVRAAVKQKSAVSTLSVHGQGDGITGMSIV